MFIRDEALLWNDMLLWKDMFMFKMIFFMLGEIVFMKGISRKGFQKPHRVF